jgi:hypothetical protein
VRGAAIGWRMCGPRRAEVQPVAPQVTGIIAAHHAGNILPVDAPERPRQHSGGLVTALKYLMNFMAERPFCA